MKARAVADALSRASGDVLVVVDSDVWSDGIGPAVAAVLAGAPWAVPHLLVHRLDGPSTATVLAGGPLCGTLAQRPYGGMVGGGVVILRRDVWESCPLDPRFAGWGQEDQAWGEALTAIHGPPWRGGADLWHLWHDPQARVSRTVGSMTGRALAARYTAAAGDAAATRRLLDEIDDKTGERAVWIYRNVNGGEDVESPHPVRRLDALPNWVVIGRPVVDPVSLPRVAEPVERDVEAKPDRTSTPDAPPAPQPSAPKSEWLAHAAALGVAATAGMTKAALIQACRDKA